MIEPYGWNTWDYRSYNMFAFLSDGSFKISLRIGTFDEKRLSHRADFRWRDLVLAGPHSIEGGYISYRFKDDESIFEVEAASFKNELTCRINPIEKTSKRIVVEIIPAGGCQIQKDGSLLKLDKWVIISKGMYFKDSFFIRCKNDYLISDAGKGGAFFICKNKGREKINNSDYFLNKASKTFFSSVPKGEGFLRDCLEGVMCAVSWNTIYDIREKGICTPVSRDWCKDWKGALIFCWDTFLIGLLSSVQDYALPWHNFDAVFHGVTKDGFVPNYAISSGVKSFDRSQPPVGSFCVLKTHCITPNKDKLRELYPKLLKWHNWWLSARDGNGDGLLEWGSNPSPKYEFPELLKYNPYIQHEHICAAYESGQDNSPVFDELIFNKEKNVFECSDIGLNSLYALDAEALSVIAKELHLTADAERLNKEYLEIKDKINNVLWSEEDGIYLNRKWNGDFVRRLSPINFFPLTAGIASKEQAEIMVKKHLLNEHEFWGNYAAPTIARNDPAFSDNNYWRGRIWPPFNYLLYEGLRRYDFHDIANEFAMKSLDAFLKNWRENNRICENYNSVNGNGTDVPNSDPLYAWGALMGYVGIQELGDINNREGLRFGNLSGNSGSVKKLRIGKHIYDVAISSKGLFVRRDGKDFFSTSSPAIVRKLIFIGKRIIFEFIPADAENSIIRFYNFTPNTRYSVCVNGRAIKTQSDGKGRLVIRL